MVYLITGKQGAGKTHYADEFARELKSEGMKVWRLDGDAFRAQNENHDYSDDGRMKNLMAAAKQAAEFESSGFIVVMSFIAPKREWREAMRTHWRHSCVIYVPGGKLWPGTEYERPKDIECSLI